MSLLLVGSLAYGRLEILCQECKRPVGLFSLEEIGAMSCAGVEVKCFECEGGKADSVPLQLRLPDDYFTINIDGADFMAGWCESKEDSSVFDLLYCPIGLGEPFDAMLKLAGLGGVPLSSSTYQHKTDVVGSEK